MLYGRFGDGISYSTFGRFVAFGALCDGLSAVPHALWGAQEQAKRLAWIKVGTTLVSQALTFALLLGTSLGVLSIYWAGVITPTLLLGVYLPYAYGSYGVAWDTAVLKRALAFGLPMVVHLTSHWVLDAADRLMLKHYLGLDAVGLYSAAYGSVGTLLMINMSMNSAYVPQFTRAHGDPAQREFVAKAITWFLAVSACASVAFMIVSGTMIRLFYSSQFLPSASLSPVLCAAMFFQAVYLVYVNGLFHAKKTTFIPIGTVLAGAGHIGLNAVLIPRFSIAGAAWATLLGYVLLALFFAVGCNLVTRIPFDRPRLLRVLGPMAGLAVVAWLVDGVLPLPFEVPLKLALLGAIPASLLLSGFLGPEERSAVRGWLQKRAGWLFRISARIRGAQ
jgi:O-antigen/teichoic acid export membrane protein